ncbi:MAG: hypothetical protein Fur0035_06060 [Anaerolineales bacterium]
MTDVLSQADTFRLARLSEQNQTLFWPDEAAAAIWDLTHGHPYLTQALCSQVWEAAYDEVPDAPPTVRPLMVEAAVEEALDASRNTLEWLWNGLGPAEKVVSAALAGAGCAVVDEARLEQILREGGVRILIRELQNAPQQLVDWDILEPVEGGYLFRVEMLRRWLAKYRPLSRAQDELDRIQPAADSLFRAAESIYQNGDLQQAEALLRQALGLNANHLRANQMLAELLISQARLEEARALLESLLQNAPHIARPRLTQIYLAQAAAAPDDKARLALYEQTLALDSTQPEARAGVEKIKQLEQQEKDLAFAYLEGHQALQRGEWPKAVALLQKVVEKRPGYIYDPQRDLDSAADLLAQAVRENKNHPPRWRLWLRQAQTIAFLAGIAAILLTSFSFGMGQRAFSLCVGQRYQFCGTFAPSLTPSLTPTFTPTFTPTLTPTLTPTPYAGATLAESPNGSLLVFIPDPSQAYWMQESEVTTQMFLNFLQSVRASITPEANGDSWRLLLGNQKIAYLPGSGDQQWGRIGWDGSQYFLRLDAYKNHPAVYVSWYGAKAYCEWLGAEYRLPTEAEWEYAARGGLEKTSYPWGDASPICTAGAQNGANYSACGEYDTMKTKSFAPNKYGLYDMAGNVWEWTDSLYNNGSAYVLRGGSWDSLSGDLLRVSYRDWFDPANTYGDIGFRCVRSR